MDPADIVGRYGSSRGWQLKRRSILVEGTSDVSLFEFAAECFLRESGKNLLEDLAIVAAGEGDRGGTRGVVRELVVLRQLALTYLSQNGRPVYRIVGLFDNDLAGRNAINGARSIDAAIREYRDVFRLRPAMPIVGNLDPATLQNQFESANQAFKGLDWEVEDLIGKDLMQLFFELNPTALLREQTAAGACHRELTRDGKSRLVRFCTANADLTEVRGVVDVLHALRCYLNLPDLR